MGGRWHGYGLAASEEPLGQSSDSDDLPSAPASGNGPCNHWLFEGRFVVQRRLGHGGAGVVLAVSDCLHGGEYALKVLSANPSCRADRLRFAREYRVASRLTDARFVRAHHWGLHDNAPYFTMDLMRGGSLARAVRAFPERKLPPRVAVGFALQVLGALDYLHARNITHRDIKPANLLLETSFVPSKSNNVLCLPKIRLTDFGIVRLGDLTDDDTRVGRVCGTPNYMAPELLRDGVADPRVDIFALGVVIYEFITGKHPMSGGGQTRAQIRKFIVGDCDLELGTSLALVPTDLAAILRRMLATDPKDRPQTAAIAYDALRAWWEKNSDNTRLPETPPLVGSPYLAICPLVGRQQELTRIDSFLETALAPSPSSDSTTRPQDLASRKTPRFVLTIRGAVGTGKSRLIWQLTNMVRKRKAVLLMGQCKQDVKEPYEGIADVLRQLATVEKDLGLGSSRPNKKPILLRSDEPFGIEIPTWVRRHAPRHSALFGVPHMHPSELREQSEPSLNDARGSMMQTRKQHVEDPSTTSSSSLALQGRGCGAMGLSQDPQTAEKKASEDVACESSGPHNPNQVLRRVPDVMDQSFELLRRVPRDGVEAIQQNELRRRLFLEQTAARLVLLSETYPVVVIVEDMQWFDPSTWGLLAYLISAIDKAKRAGQNCPIAFVLSHRPGQDTASRLAALQRQVDSDPWLNIDLEPMTSNDCTHLVSSLLMTQSSPALATFTAALCEGREATPLYVEQALRVLLHSGALTEGQHDASGRWAGTWNLKPAAIHAASLPTTVQGAIGEQLCRLSVHTQGLLMLASAIGRQFSLRLLADASRSDPSEVLDYLDEASQAGFIRSADNADPEQFAGFGQQDYEFSHDRHRDALYSRIDPRHLRTFHRSIAASIRQAAGDDPSHWDALAHHCACAGDHAQAFQFGVMAADADLNKGAYERACVLYAAALSSAASADCVVDSQIRARFADASVANGDFDTASVQYHLCLDTTPPGPARWDLKRRIAELNYRRLDMAHALAPLEDLLAELGAPVPKSRFALWLKTVLASWRIIWFILTPNLLPPRTPCNAAESAKTAMLDQVFYLLAECCVFSDGHKVMYAGMLSAYVAVRAGNAERRACRLASLAYGAAFIGMHKRSRKLSNAVLKRLESVCDRGLAAQAYTSLIMASVCRSDFTAGANQRIIANGWRAADASGDIQRQFIFRIATWLYLQYSGRVRAALAVVDSIRELSTKYHLPIMDAWAVNLEATSRKLLGQFERSISLHSAAASALEQSGNVLGALTVRSCRVFEKSMIAAKLPQEHVRAAMLEGLESAEQFLEMNFRETTHPASAYAGAVLCAFHLKDVPPSVWKRLWNLQRPLRKACKFDRSGAPLTLAAQAALRSIAGRNAEAKALFGIAELQARKRGNISALIDVYRLAARTHPEPAERDLCQSRELRLVARASALPVPTCQQLAQGDFGPAPEC